MSKISKTIAVLNFKLLTFPSEGVSRIEHICFVVRPKKQILIFIKQNTIDKN